jgi:hypothetical protein
MQDFYGLKLPHRETMTGVSTWNREVSQAKINDVIDKSQENYIKHNNKPSHLLFITLSFLMSQNCYVFRCFSYSHQAEVSKV